jgi:4-hydroxybenzoate polyprenyltransferase
MMMYTINAWLKSVRLWNVIGLSFAAAIIRFSYFGNEIGWFFMVPVACIAAGGAVINDYFDIKEDRIRKPERASIGRVIKRRVAMMSHWVLTGMGLVGAVVISIQIDNMSPFIIASVAAFLIFLYSIWLKKKVVVGKLALAAIVTLLVPFALYDVLMDVKDERYVVMCLMIFSIVFVRQISKELEYFDVDKDSGIRTMPVVFGETRSWMVIYVMEVVIVTIVWSALSVISELQPKIIFSLTQYPFEIFFHITLLATIYFSVRKKAPALSSWLKLMLATGVIWLAVGS